MRNQAVCCSIGVMIPFGILLCLYALGSWFLPLMGKQLMLMLWMDKWAPQAQWSVRAVLCAAGIALIVFGIRRRRAAR